MKDKTTTVHLAARIPVSVADRFKSAADADHRTVSSLLRVLIEAEIERHEHALAAAGKKEVGK